MHLKADAWPYINAIAFPVFFVLHGVNEHFGLIGDATVLRLLIYYSIVSIGISFAARMYLSDRFRAIVLTATLLCFFYFFGAIKDIFDAPYRIYLPAIALSIIFCIWLIVRTRLSLKRTAVFISTVLLVFVSVELGMLVNNIVSGKVRQKDLGDIDHSLVKSLHLPDSIRKPTIFWIVMDEYAGTTSLQKRWKFNNPLNSVLRSKGFFAADSAMSPYNYTHYSLASTLDMTYLNDLKEHSEIGFRDIVRGNISLVETNTVKLLESRGYDIHNFTIYNIDKRPTKAQEYFIDADFKLIDNQTMPGRIRQDLGWNFTNADIPKGLAGEYRRRMQLLQEGIEAAKVASKQPQPSFFMFHFMLTHEPFLYLPDGSLDSTSGFGMAPEKYIPSITYANKALTKFIDSLMSIYADQEMAIILQGDHGYKFDETDPLFDTDGCSILYAVYCSDKYYPAWNQSFNSVNTFRVLFNKYFLTNLPILENRSINLYYR